MVAETVNWSLPTIVAGVIAVVCMSISGHHYWSAVGDVRPRLPAQFQDYVLARQVLDSYIWDRSIPRRAQRSYFLSLVFGAVGFAAFAAIVWMYAPRLPAVLSAVMSIYGFVYVFIRWRKYRDLP
jgi:hypothetical protein